MIQIAPQNRLLIRKHEKTVENQKFIMGQLLLTKIHPNIKKIVWYFWRLRKYKQNSEIALACNV